MVTRKLSYCLIEKLANFFLIRSKSMANWPWMTLVSGEVMYQNHRNDKNLIKIN